MGAILYVGLFATLRTKTDRLSSSLLSKILWGKFTWTVLQQ